MRRYLSTRGGSPPGGFAEVLLGGLAPDGGLYLPESLPLLDPGGLAALATGPYAALAARVLAPFTEGFATEADLRPRADAAYRTFTHPATVPLVQLDRRLWLMELFHGPTLAFKDLALQLLGQLFDLALAQSGHRLTVLGATSGDTGSAAIEACRSLDRVDSFILYPHGRPSEVQRRQMTTVPGDHVHALAIEGSFDDCQRIVKQLMGDAALSAELCLAAVNSINWARVAAQTVYYVSACLAFGWRPLRFAVPTGNFGNVYAGHVARGMGAPIAGLTIGTNANDILVRALATGDLRPGPVQATLSPSMDIQVSSNFERLVYELAGRDPSVLRATLAAGRLGETTRAAAAAAVSARAVSDPETLATIARVHAESGVLVDPHTAVGIAAARASDDREGPPVVALACAHPAKFPEAVKRATGVTPALPPHLSDLWDRPERIRVLPADPASVVAYLRRHTRIRTDNG